MLCKKLKILQDYLPYLHCVNGHEYHHSDCDHMYGYECAGVHEYDYVWNKK